MLSFALEFKLKLLEEKDFIYKEWGKGMQAPGKFIATSMYSNSMIGDGLKCLQGSSYNKFLKCIQFYGQMINFIILVYYLKETCEHKMRCM
jgi:hypothetical protein